MSVAVVQTADGDDVTSVFRSLAGYSFLCSFRSLLLLPSFANSNIVAMLEHSKALKVLAAAAKEAWISESFED